MNRRPEVGELVHVRSRQWIVNGFKVSTLPPAALTLDFSAPQNLDALPSVEDDGLGEELQVLWEVEPGATVIEKVAMTAMYNRFHYWHESSAGIQTLRNLHVEIGQGVSIVSDWKDFTFDRRVQETKQCLRFTISEPARHEVLQLNHERYAEEVKQGLHDKKAAKKRPAANSNADPGDQETVAPPTKRRAPKKSPKPKSSDPQTIAEERTLFSMEDDE